MTTTVVLLHSPLTTAAVWGPLPALLRERGHDVVVPEVLDDDRPPYAARYVASVAHVLQSQLGAGAAVLVGHSGAGPLLPQVAFARHAAQARVDGYVLLDAMLPRVPRASTRLDLLRLEDAVFADQLDAHLRAGGQFPDWTDADLVEVLPDDDQRHAVLGSMRPRDLAFFTEPLPQPEDWPDAPVAYVQLSAAYDQAAATARLRGWTVRSLALHHFAMLTDPDDVADALADLLSRA